MIPRKLSVMISRFPYGGNGGYSSEIPEIADWLVETTLEMGRDERISEVIPWRVSDTPVSMCRNRAVLAAKQHQCDFLLMIDSDNVPDYELKRGDKSAKPFWKTAFDFLYQHYDKGPAVIAAPYCGPPPHENVYVFQISNKESEHANIDFQVDQFTRHQAAERTGIEQVAALPTGLILFDVRAFDLLPPPWFYYEWTDRFEAHKASTEDVTATRDMMFHVHLEKGYLPLYVAWDCWAGHVKPKIVGKPQIIKMDQVSQKLVEAARRGQDSREGVRVMDSLAKFLEQGAKPYTGTKPAVAITPLWQPIEAVERQVAAIAKGKVIDFGGNATHRLACAQQTCGWEGDIRCDFISDALPFSDQEIDFAYCRHTVEDLADPTHFLNELNRVAKSGYIETPSPLVELTRGVTGSQRGFVHHNWYVWSEGGVLHFLPKHPNVETSAIRQYTEELSDKFNWNTYHIWDGQLQFKVWRHERDYDIAQRPQEYEALLTRACDCALRGAAAMKQVVAVESVEIHPASATPAPFDEAWQTPVWMLEQYGFTPQQDLRALRQIVQDMATRLGREPIVVELGTYIGQSAKAMADAGATVFSIDNREGNLHDPIAVHYALRGREDIERACKENLGELNGRKVHLLLGDAIEGARTWSKPIDLLYVDADHDYEPTKAHIRAWMGHVREGGIIAGHDYDKDFPGVVKAVDELFPERHVDGRIWWTVKPSTQAFVNRLAGTTHPAYEEDVPETIANGHAG